MRQSSNAKYRYPDYMVYAVIPRPPDMLGSARKSRWVEIGVGWINADDSIRLNIELMPTVAEYTLMLRPYRLPGRRPAAPTSTAANTP